MGASFAIASPTGEELRHNPGDRPVAAGQYAAVMQALEAGPADALEIADRAQADGNPLQLIDAMRCLHELAEQGRVVRAGPARWRVAG